MNAAIHVFLSWAPYLVAALLILGAGTWWSERDTGPCDHEHRVPRQRDGGAGS